MTVEYFLDTNIVLYAYDSDAGFKRNRALNFVQKGWSEPGSTAISVQVLQEFYVNFIRKRQSHGDAVQIIEDLAMWPVIDNSLERFGHGLVLKEKFQISLWDAMILAAAHASGAPRLLSEDLNHGQNYDGVTVINPFLDSSASS